MVLAIMLFITATVFVVFDKATFSDWARFMEWAFGIFALGNLGEHASKMKVFTRDNTPESD